MQTILIVFFLSNMRWCSPCETINTNFKDTIKTTWTSFYFALVALFCFFFLYARPNYEGSLGISFVSMTKRVFLIVNFVTLIFHPRKGQRRVILVSFCFFFFYVWKYVALRFCLFLVNISIAKTKICHMRGHQKVSSKTIRNNDYN